MMIILLIKLYTEGHSVNLSGKMSFKPSLSPCEDSVTSHDPISSHSDITATTGAREWNINLLLMESCDGVKFKSIHDS